MEKTIKKKMVAETPRIDPTSAARGFAAQDKEAKHISADDYFSLLIIRISICKKNRVWISG